MFYHDSISVKLYGHVKTRAMSNSKPRPIFQLTILPFLLLPIRADHGFFVLDQTHSRCRFIAPVGLHIVENMTLTIIAVKLPRICSRWVRQTFLCNHLVVFHEAFKKRMTSCTENGKNSVLRVDSIRLLYLEVFLSCATK